MFLQFDENQPDIVKSVSITKPLHLGNFKSTERIYVLINLG